MEDIYVNELEYASVEAFEKANPALVGAIRNAVREELETAQANSVDPYDIQVLRSDIEELNVKVTMYIFFLVAFTLLIYGEVSGDDLLKAFAIAGLLIWILLAIGWLVSLSRS